MDNITLFNMKRKGNEKIIIDDITDLFKNGVRLMLLDKIDTIEVVNFHNMFNGCSSLTSIPELNTSNGTNFSNMFKRCSSLTSIPELNISNGTNFSNMFTGCSSLTDITFTGKIKYSISLSESPLSTESAGNILIALENYSGTSNEFKYSISFSRGVWDRLVGEGTASPEGTTWKQYVQSKGWNI